MERRCSTGESGRSPCGDCHNNNTFPHSSSALRGRQGKAGRGDGTTTFSSPSSSSKDSNSTMKLLDIWAKDTLCPLELKNRSKIPKRIGEFHNRFPLLLSLYLLLLLLFPHCCRRRRENFNCVDSPFSLPPSLQLLYPPLGEEESPPPPF